MEINPSYQMENTISHNTASLLRYAETAKSLRIDTEELALKIGQKLVSSNTALTTEFENDLVNSINEKILNIKQINKNIYLNQRLSDAEKTSLLQNFSPPYKLVFSNNPTDIGSHKYYRALNEIATFRCYDLIDMDEKVPPGYDILVKESGAAIMKLVKYNRNVHGCTPNLCLDDSLRITNTEHSLLRSLNTSDKKKNFLAKQYLNRNPLYRCFNRSQYCTIKSKYIVFAHSSYDNSMYALANIMDAANAVLGIGFIHYSSKIISSLRNGSDNGLNWRTILRNKTYFIEFWFDNDYQNSYVHNLDTYLAIIKNSTCTSRRGVTYIVQRREELGGLLFYNIIKPIVDIPRSHIFRQLPFSDEDNVIIHYYKLQNDASKFFYHELIPIKLIVPKKFFEKLYFYLETMPDGKFTIQNALIFASTLANRTIINGSYVSSPYNLDIEQVDNIAYATYFIVYCRRYDMISVLSKLKGFEDLKRNMTFYKRLCNLFHNVRDSIMSVNFSKYKPEKVLEDVIQNLESELENEEVLTYSKNVLQWLCRLWRVNPRYDVRFYPVTRVVSIEEDIAMSKSVIDVLPVLANDKDENLLKYISDTLNITRVKSDACKINECKCNVPLIEVRNNFSNFCVFKAFSNSLNIDFKQLLNIIETSETFLNLMPTMKINVSKSLTTGVCDLEIFELLALEFHVNICVHTESFDRLYNVSSEITKHFKITDNHCIQLIEKLNMTLPTFQCKSYRPFVYNNPSKNIDYYSQLNKYLESENKKEIRFKSFLYKIDNIYPFPCKSFLKLMEIDMSMGLITSGNVVELSAAPGSWIKYVELFHSQSNILFSYYYNGLKMEIDCEGMTCLNDDIQGDMTNEDDVIEILDKLYLEGCADTFLSDIAIMDGDALNVEMFQKYIYTVFNTLPLILNRGANVLIKSFTEIDEKLYTSLQYFQSVSFVKPNFSNPLSSEYYVVMKNFDPNHNIEHEFTNIHTPILERQYLFLKRANEGRFNAQKNFVLPYMYSVETKATHEALEPVVKMVPELDLVETIQECDLSVERTFESDLLNSSSRFQFSNTDNACLRVVDADVVSFNPDILLVLYSHSIPELAGAIYSTDYMIDVSNLNVEIGLKCTGELDVFARISSIFSAFHTFKLKYQIDVRNLNNPVSEKKIFDLLEEYQHSNDIILITNIDPTVSSCSLTTFEKSISEYISYCNNLRAVNNNTYAYYFNSMRVSDYKLSTTMIANLKNDSQNISVRMGETYVFKHPKAKEDGYSHFFNGTEFLPASDLESNIFNLVGDYCHRMFDSQITKKLKQIDVNKLGDVQFKLIQGVAGHGKTREIVNKHKMKLKSNRGTADLVLSPTKAGRQVLISRTVAHNKIKINNIDQNYYKTITSFLINDNRLNVNNVFVDEVMMVHSALILAIAYYSKSKFIYLYGDTCQIPFHSALGDFSFTYNNPLSLFTINEVREKSYRIPADVAATLNDIYFEKHSSFGFRKGIITTSVKLRSVKVVKINSVNEMLNYFNDDTVYLTFTHTTENELNKLKREFNPQTIAAYQGSESKQIAVVRTSFSPAEKIYNDIHLCVTALTRHTDSFTYYTTCTNDALTRFAESAMAFTDYKIKGYSTSLNVAGTEVDVLPFMENTSAVKKFFVSTNKMPDKFILVDHESYGTERELVNAVHSLSLKTRKQIVLRKGVFKKFDMNMLKKNFYKYAPSIKSIKVKVSSVSFDENLEVKDIVETYKCTNVIQTSVTEKLEQIVTPYFPDIPKITNYIEVSPSIEMLQTFLSHLFPQCCFVNTSLDSTFVHSSDVEYTLSNMSICTLKDIPKMQRYDKLRPVLSTPCPNIRDCTQREIILGVQKRNLNPPELILNSSPDHSSDHLLQNFCGKLCIKNFELVINEMEPLRVTSESVISWLEKQDRVVLKMIQNEIPFFLSSLSDCALSLKRSPKIRITQDAVDVYDSVQTITYHPKFINAYFCSLIDQLQDRILNCLLPYIVFNTKLNLEELDRICTRKYQQYNKIYMFAGDDSLLVNNFNFKEMDMSKFDKSQLLFALEFLCKLFVRFGMTTADSQLYFEMMYFRICRDPSNKVTMYLTPQMESGCAATFLGNTCFCAAVIASCIEFDTFNYLPQMSKFSLMFNLETKEFDFKYPYFCSKFLVISETEFKFIPDPLKIAIKLGRRDLVNYVHMQEFHTSLLDLIAAYNNSVDLEVLAAAISERYSYPYNCTYHIRNLVSVIRDKNLFKHLYFTLPEDILNSKLEKFPDYF
ncbi:ORF1 [Andrena haemorrhoa nege-like virus]|uniref:ORF1 n=1 Tax=Andrena haemorrhoa nege-like virus TaxID=2094259 RepID=A0A2L2P6U6_9VIRU|nr:ORF1 [Andrena haemorrhoa nege-like virus]AVH76845.1 ORF1 [Andrena haemorrhoa nege-like virus]